MENNTYNPDVLNCIANLSNDEVFTPPALANQVLDLLPQELFRSPTTTFLDPFCKSGVFLREIVKRLDRGLSESIPDRQQRIDHIMHRQVFGIALTELTSLLSRRTLYCSKRANSPHSVSRFDNEEGHVQYQPIPHTWVNGKCRYCGASQEVYDRGNESEQYAYQFIHTDNPKNLFPKDMTFDVIIGNPPYQLGDGGNGASALPIYHMFIQQAKKLSPRYMSFIVPARWLNGGRGLDDFRKEMLTEQKIKVLHDFFDSKDCFSGVEIKGGICYFLWGRNYCGNCDVYTHVQGETHFSNRPLLEKDSDIFIRSVEQVSIYHKVCARQEKCLSSWLFAGRYFGFHTKIKWHNEYGEIQSADGKDYYSISKIQDEKYQVKVYVHGGCCWIDEKSIPRNGNRVWSYKVLIPRSGNPGFGNTIIGKPKLSEPGSCSSNTYMVAIPADYDMQKHEAENLLLYIKTRFVRFLVATKTSTQSTPPDAFAFVPLQNFSHPWTDEMLYKKYGLDEHEVAFIESMIRPME